MDERDEPARHETTVINTGSGGGSGGIIAGVLLVLVIGIAAFLYFGGYIGHGSQDRDINVNASLKMPDININPPSAPSASPPANPPAPSNPPAGNSGK